MSFKNAPASCVFMSAHKKMASFKGSSHKWLALSPSLSDKLGMTTEKRDGGRVWEKETKRDRQKKTERNFSSFGLDYFILPQENWLALPQWCPDSYSYCYINDLELPSKTTVLWSKTSLCPVTSYQKKHFLIEASFFGCSSTKEWFSLLTFQNMSEAETANLKGTKIQKVKTIKGYTSFFCIPITLITSW